MNKKFDFQKNPFAFYFINFLIGFVSFFHLINSWIVSRISYTNFQSELNWILLFFIVTGSLCVNYLMLKDNKIKAKFVLKGLGAFILGSLIVSIFFIIRVGL